MTVVATHDGLAGVLPMAVMAVLDRAQAHRDRRLSLRRVSLTFPDGPEVDDWYQAVLPAIGLVGPHAFRTWLGRFYSADLFANAVAAEGPGAGAVLFFDASPGSLRPHWYGYAITRRDDFEVDRLWNRIANHRMTPDDLWMRVQAVVGQHGTWSKPIAYSSCDRDEAAEQTFQHLDVNVKSVAAYAVKPLPEGVPLGVVDRVLMTGGFADLLDPYIPKPPLYLPCAVPGCAKPMLPGRRSHARYCSDNCRKTASRTSRKSTAVAP